MPSLNEAETLEICIQKALAYMERDGIEGEVLIADNGSTDGSQEIARKAGARVVDVPRRGYGAALRGGIEAARGKYIIMGDSDDSYDFSDLSLYVERLRAGDELVMGNRFAGGIKPGAMPNLHRYLGNPFLTMAGRVLFGCPIGDSQCGLRGFSKEAIEGLGLRTSGMEFASEMVVKSTLSGIKIGEVPTTLSPDGRSRPPHLRSWRDGSRILHFLLIHSPRWLFATPGFILVLLGLILFGAILPGPVEIMGVTLDVHTLVAAAGMVILGVMSLSFSIIAKQFGVSTGVFPDNRDSSTLLRLWRPARAYVLGGILLLVGLGGMIYALSLWGATGLGDLEYQKTMRIVIPAVTAMVVGAQLVLSGFMTSVFDLNVSRD